MRHRYFDRAEFARHFPELSSSALRGGFTYADAQTDDGRLVLELVSGAMDAGAKCVNYCELVALNEISGIATGATLLDKVDGGTLNVHARSVVKATGQWMAEADVSRAWCRLSKGVHLLLPNMRLEEALLLTAQSDGRVFFIIPWYGLTLVGTTDTDYRGDAEHVRVEKADVDYLLSEVNHYLKRQYTENDVIGSYAGVRVMRQSDAATPSAVSRDWVLKTGNDGAMYSVGGKITSAREDAAAIVDAVCDKLDVKISCATNERMFPWAPEVFCDWSESFSEHAGRLGIDAESSKWIMRRHGKRADHILLDVETDPKLAERIVPELPLVYADLFFCAREEMVVHLEDLLRRRMPLLILAKLTQGQIRKIARSVSEIMGWDESRLKQEVLAVVSRRDYPNLSVI
jgi:glycerol-3-phosphate dehydrogenase